MRVTTDFICRYPDDEQLVEIAQVLKLSAKQAAALHYAIADLVQSIRTLKLAKEQFGPQSPAVAGLRRISKNLTAAERDLQAADPIIMDLLNSGYGKLLGKLAKAKSDPWLDRLAIKVQDDEIFKPAKKREKEVLATVRNVNSTVAEVVETLGRRSVGSPGKVYRNAALKYLVPVYQVILDKKPTPTRGGQFMLFCELILQAIGLDVRGVDKAVEQVLKKMRTQNSRPSPQSTPKKGPLWGTLRRS